MQPQIPYEICKRHFCFCICIKEQSHRLVLHSCTALDNGATGFVHFTKWILNVFLQRILFLQVKRFFSFHSALLCHFKTNHSATAFKYQRNYYGAPQLIISKCDSQALFTIQEYIRTTKHLKQLKPVSFKNYRNNESSKKPTCFINA